MSGNDYNWPKETCEECWIKKQNVSQSGLKLGTMAKVRGIHGN